MSVGPLCTASNDGVPPYTKHLVMRDGWCRNCGLQIMERQPGRYRWLARVDMADLWDMGVVNVASLVLVPAGMFLHWEMADFGHVMQIVIEGDKPEPEPKALHPAVRWIIPPQEAANAQR